MKQIQSKFFSALKIHLSLENACSRLNSDFRKILDLKLENVSWALVLWIARRCTYDAVVGEFNTTHGEYLELVPKKRTFS